MKKKESNQTLREMEVVYSIDGDIPKRQKITSSKHAFDYLIQSFNKLTIGFQEEFNVMYLNNALVPLGIYKASKGGISQTSVDIRLILSVALKSLATGIIISHNHPSGTLEPSMQDRKLTKSIKAACDTLDIKLLDHVIVTPFDSMFSFADNGLL